jgi:hypothetical protein
MPRKNRDWLTPNMPPGLRELLDRVEAVVTQGEFLILPESGQPKVSSFASMDTYERFCTLRDHIDWNGYLNGGVGVEQAERVMNNALAGRPRGEWLDEPEFEHAKAQAVDREV